MNPLRILTQAVCGLLLVCLFLTSSAFTDDSELTDEQKTKIDQIFADWNRKDSPGVAVGVVRDGNLLYSNGYGLADLEHDVPITSSTVFYMASVSKHFVTFCILLLEEQGKLNLDDEIQKYLPDFPEYDSPLTIRHFIHHTSGVRDSLTLWRLAGNDYLDYIHDEALYDLIKRQKSLNFPPGERYLYSNSCYFMLAMIVEKASGSTIREFADKHMFQPLGMKNTHFHDDVNQIIKNRAFSYQASGTKGFENIIMRFDLVGSGGLYSTIEDMARWDHNFNENKLGKGSAALIEKMLTEGKLNNGKSCNYAFGLQNQKYRGLATVEHGGALAGYRTYYLRFPEQNTSITILANVGNVNTGGKAREVADVVLAEALGEKNEPGNEKPAAKDPPKINEIKLPVTELRKFVGTFEIEGGPRATIRIQNGKLHVLQNWNGSSYDIAPTSKTTFVIPQDPAIQFEFSEVVNGKARKLTVDQGGRKMIASRVARLKLNKADLEEYTGTYFSEELNVNYELFMDNGLLHSRIGHNAAWTLRPQGKDRFQRAGVTFTFLRKDGVVTGIKLDAGRVQGIEMVKQ